MKEQDTAHSFKKGVDIICEECKSEKAIHYANDKYFCSGCFAKEYTRLRSELKNLDTIRKEEFKVLSRENTKLTSELQQEREKVKFLQQQIADLRERNKDSSPF